MNLKQSKNFLDFYFKYNKYYSNQYVCGMGKDNLLAKGDL